jgi:hypothetical protein
LARHPAVSQKWAERNDKKNVSWAEIAGQDLTKGMGTRLTRKRSVQFISFGDVVKVYQDSFRGAVASAFTDCSDVFHAEKVRHLIAHRAGIVDQKFKDDMRDLGRHEYDNVSTGERIPINGPIVQGHFVACIRMGDAILKAVDDWSVTAPQS